MVSSESSTLAGQAGAPSSTPWILGIARFSGVELGIEALPLTDVLPRLIAADLVVLPPRLPPQADVVAAARLSEAKARFSSGTDLAARLDDRALRFLDPSLSEEARGPEIVAADKKVQEAAKKLGIPGDTPAEPTPAPPPPGPPSPPRETQLWEGNGRGELIDAPTPALGSAATAKGKSVDLLVYGTVEEIEGYAVVHMNGYDASLDTTVFSWKGFCSPEDPSPLAREFSQKLARWIAGQDFARLDIAIEPRSAAVLVDGKRLTGDSLVVYRFDPGSVLVEAKASGYDGASTEAELVLGERRSIALELKPSVLGSASISADPPDASILIDSISAGQAPLTVALSGKREIITAYAPGRERASAILPASGETSLTLELRPDDGLGPGGRVTAAKDDFYRSLGWLFISIPVSSLALGLSSLYYEAADRSSDSGLLSYYTVSGISAGMALTASVVLGVNVAIHLIRYLGTAR